MALCLWICCKDCVIRLLIYFNKKKLNCCGWYGVYESPVLDVGESTTSIYSMLEKGNFFFVSATRPQFSI